MKLKSYGGLYNTIAPSLSISRLAVRYINKIKCTTDVIDLDDILIIPPKVPNDLHVEMEGFLSRLVFHSKELDLRAILTQTLGKDIASSFPSIILDIDAFHERRDGIDKANLWLIIDNLRKFKNDIFFESITDKQIEVFK